MFVKECDPRKILRYSGLHTMLLEFWKWSICAPLSLGSKATHTGCYLCTVLQHVPTSVQAIGRKQVQALRLGLASMRPNALVIFHLFSLKVVSHVNVFQESKNSSYVTICETPVISNQNSRQKKSR